MKEMTRTIVFVAVALALGGVAWGTRWATRPRTAEVETRIGQPLFPNLQAEQVKSLEVVARDPVTQEIRRFKVENKDGVWRIPSHHNYPAEAAKRLFETATALYGTERLAMAGRWIEEQKRFGTIAPDDDSAESSDPEELGKRVILRDAQGDTLADMVLGKLVPDSGTNQRRDVFDPQRSPGQRYYVRAADEAETYVANLTIDLSTKFADWIEPDLLQLDIPEIKRLVIDNYELQIQDELTNRGKVRRIGKLSKDRHELTREKPFDPWALQGLDPEKEELNSQNLNRVTSILDDMVIAGVRPKTQLEGKPLLNPDLTVNTDFELLRTDPEAFQRVIFDLQSELMSYGFNVVPGNREGELPAFYSNRGELEVATNEGVIYNLYFGDIVQGNDEAIEVGTPAAANQSPDNSAPGADTNAKDDAAEDVAANQTPAADARDDPTDPSAKKKKNRYLMVRVRFDPAGLGAPPVEPAAPVEPVKPEGYVEVPPPAEPNVPPSGDAPPPAPPDTRDPAFIEYDQKMAEFKTAQQQFLMDSEQFKTDSADFQRRREEGERNAKRLHERFGPWFYVIAANDLESIQIPRSELVRPKSPPANEDVPAAPALPPLPDRPDLNLE